MTRPTRVSLAVLATAILLGWTWGCGQLDPEPIDGTLLVTSVDEDGGFVSDASVFIDGLPVGKTPLEVEVLRGPHSIDVETFDGYVGSSAVVVARGERTEVSVVVEPGPTVPAYVSVRTALSGSPIALEGVPVHIDTHVVGRTPLVIAVSPGLHRASVDSMGFVPEHDELEVIATRGDTVDVAFEMRPGYQTTVLCEDFTNSGCQGCPEVEEMLIDITMNIPLEDVLTVSLHTRIPDPTDPMFLANYPELYARYTSLYGVGANPAVAVGGHLIDTVPPPAEAVVDRIEAGRSTVSPVHLSAIHTVDDNSGDVGIDITIRSVRALPGDWRLLAMTLQSEMHFETPPGSNGQKTFTRVVRDLAPSATGLPLEIVENMNEVVRIDAQLLTTASPPDDIGQLGVVVVLQDWVSKEIVQAALSVHATQS